MEFDPKAALSNVLQPAIKSAQQIGDTVLRYGEGFMSVFTRPEVAAELAQGSQAERAHEDELLYKLEAGIDDHATQAALAHNLFVRAAEKLKTVESERSEDDILFLKRVRGVFEEYPGTAIGVARLSEEDRSLLLNYFVPRQQ